MTARRRRDRRDQIDDLLLGAWISTWLAMTAVIIYAYWPRR